MPPLTDVSRPRARLERRRPAVVTGAIAILIGALMIDLVSIARPPTSRTLTISDPHPWQVQVRIAGDPVDGWTPIGSVDRQTEATFLQVPDQGDRWTVEAGYAGVATRFVVSRAELEANGWRIEVPGDIATQLTAEGVEPSAPPP